MADVINLRQARKVKARTEKAAKAEQNRAKFGRSKAEKSLQKAENAKEERALDGKRRTPSVVPVAPENTSDDV